MKKTLALIMSIILIIGTVFAFSSCGKKDDNKLVCGITIIPGLNEKDENGNWIGFESEFAMEVGKLLDMEVEFQEIDWGQKYNELNSGAIDCVWNGFTANSSDDGKKRSDLVDFSYGYMLNQQCVVVKKDNVDSYKTEDDLKGKKACVEAGSAGAAYAESVTDKDKIFTSTAQINAFTEVKSGAVDFIVVDILLAKNLCGKGDYADLAIVEAIELESEIYAVGFKKGSELTAKVNEAIKTLEENGKLMEIAKKYGFENVIQITEKIPD